MYIYDPSQLSCVRSLGGAVINCVKMPTQKVKSRRQEAAAAAAVTTTTSTLT